MASRQDLAGKSGPGLCGVGRAFKTTVRPHFSQLIGGSITYTAVVNLNTTAFVKHQIHERSVCDKCANVSAPPPRESGLLLAETVRLVPVLGQLRGVVPGHLGASGICDRYVQQLDIQPRG